jgi:hypothetical protein
MLIAFSLAGRRSPVLDRETSVEAACGSTEVSNGNARDMWRGMSDCVELALI